VLNVKACALSAERCVIATLSIATLVESARLEAQRRNTPLIISDDHLSSSADQIAPSGNRFFKNVYVGKSGATVRAS